MVVAVPVSMIKGTVLVVSKTSWSRSFMGI